MSAWSSILFSAVVACSFAAVALAEDAGGRYLALVRRHYNRVLAAGRDTYGPAKTGMWLSSIDIRKGGLPASADAAHKRCYRLIHAPRGSTLYWDQPAVVCAHELSRRTHDARYARAAEAYVRAFLKRCVSGDNGIFLWGNHIYYDVVKDKNVFFSGGHHEARPLPIAWELFWNVSPKAAERCIRTMAAVHVDPKTGCFNRHGSTKNTSPPKTSGAMPFLEAGGVLVESLCWLYAKGGRREEALLELARKVARYSFAQRGRTTGLLRNQPVVRRWDYRTATTEVGLWAGCLLRAGERAQCEELSDLARRAVEAYLRFAWDEQAGMFLGRLNVADGKPAGEPGTPYAPGKYADVWQPLFPTHDYPMRLAEACVTLYERTDKPLFRRAIERWVRHVRRSLPARAHGRRGAYAGNYGRCIHFLLRAAAALGSDAPRDLARTVADDAVARLYDRRAGMFRTHPGEDRCDAVDGAGVLFLALIRLDTGRECETMGFGF